jgi:hypothetical protein
LSAHSGVFTTGTGPGASSASAGCPGAASVTQSITVDAATAGRFTVVVQLQSAGTTVPPVVVNFVASN